MKRSDYLTGHLDTQATTEIIYLVPRRYVKKEPQQLLGILRENLGGKSTASEVTANSYTLYNKAREMVYFARLLTCVNEEVGQNWTRRPYLHIPTEQTLQNQ